LIKVKNSRNRIKRNLFLHLHSAKTHPYSLKWNFTFGLGIICIGLFLILSLSGFLLMLYYKPDTARAYFSIKDLMYVVPSGRLVRNIHRWAAHMMVIACFLHMARVFYTSAYKRGRTFNWNIGLCLFLLTLGLSFTGYLLPWDQLAYWACTIGVNIIAATTQLTDIIGVSHLFNPGLMVKHLLLGADQIGNDALVRFYGLHCMALPLLMTIFIVLHIWHIRKAGGLARPDRFHQKAPDESSVSAMVETYPKVLVLEFTIFMATLAVVTAVSYFFDAPLREPANPLQPENPAKAPWYFSGIQELVSYSAFTGGIVIPLAAILTLSIIPLIDKEDKNFGVWFADDRDIRITISSACYTMLCCGLFLGLSVGVNWPGIWFGNHSGSITPFINSGTLLVLMFALWSLAWLKIYHSTRAGAVAFFTCLFAGIIIFSYFGWTHRGPNWDFYWWPSLWRH